MTFSISIVVFVTIYACKILHIIDRSRYFRYWRSRETFEVKYHNNTVAINSRKDILAGEHENRKIFQYIANASIIVCVITVDYLQECKSEIFEIFNNEDRLIIIPILYKACNIEGSKFDGFRIISLSEYEKDFPNKGLEAFWHHVSDHIKLRYKNELRIQERVEEDKIIAAYAGHSLNTEPKLIHLNLDEIDINQKIDMINNEDLKIRVIGESMTPDIQNNDILTCKLVDTTIKIIKNWRKELSPEIKQGKFYVVETTDQGVMVKYLQYVDNKLILISTNPSVRPIVLSTDEIISIWEVKSLYRSL